MKWQNVDENRVTIGAFILHRKNPTERWRLAMDMPEPFGVSDAPPKKRALRVIAQIERACKDVLPPLEKGRT